MLGFPSETKVFFRAHPLLILAAILFLASLALYLYTLAPVVTFIDSGILAAIVATGGVYHPAGFPLYMVLTSLAASIPFGSLIIRLNALSALCSAIGVALTAADFVIAARGSTADFSMDGSRTERPREKGQRTRSKRRSRRPMPSVREQALPLEEPTVLAGAVAAGLAWMSNGVLWRTSTVTEVYALYASLFAALGLLLVLYAHASWAGRELEAQRWLALASTTMGLGLTNDIKIVMFAPAIVFLLLRVEGRGLWRRWRRNLLMLLFLAAPLLLYVLLPIRASTDPLINWGNPSNLKNFWDHVTGKQYHVFLAAPKLDTIRHVFSLLLEEQPPVLLVVSIGGVVGLWRRRATWFWFTSILFVTNLLFVWVYDISSAEGGPSDFENYLLQFFWVASLWFGAGVAVLVYNLRHWLRTTYQAGDTAGSWRGWLTAIPLVLALTPLLMLARNWETSSHRTYTFADDFARSILNSVAPNALIISEDWNFVAPSAYLQLVEGVRTDVLVLDGELLRRSWYFSYLRQRAPWLYLKSGSTISAFLTELQKFENDQPYDGDVITAAYVAMLNNFISVGLQDAHPPYILLSPEARGLNPSQYQQLEESLGHPPYLTVAVPPDAIGKSFQWVPEAPAMRLYADRQAHALGDILLRPESFDPNRYYDDQTLGVFKRYADFWRRRGDYLRAQRNCPGARAAYLKALEFVPGLPEARSGLALCQG